MHVPESRRVWFLHLTDVHFGGPGHGRDWGAVNTYWRKDLRYFEEAIAKCPPDFVLFTGDLGYHGGRKGEYASALSLFETLDATFDAQVPVFAVPGNHDLIRPTTSSHEWLTNPSDIGRREFAFASGTEAHETVCSLFRSWENFARTKLEPRLLRVPRAKLHRGLFPGDQYLQATLKGIRIGLLGINSTWRHLDENAKCNLTVDLRQLPARVDLAELGNEHDVTFLVRHHPSSWLQHSRYGSDPLAELVDLAWVGHTHRSKITVSPTANQPREIVGASLYGPKHYLKANEGSQIGYAWGRIERIRDRLNIKMWPRALTTWKEGFHHSSHKYREGEGVPVLEKACPVWTRDSEMDDLVRVAGRCRKRSGRIHFCKYHYDRATVEFDEQPTNRTGELQRSFGRVTLNPCGVPFLSRLSSHKLAGHYGLVASQREWLTGKLECALASTNRERLTILQTGTAGPVHYLGTIRLIRDVLRQAKRKADVITIERCCGPVLLIRALKRRAVGQGRRLKYGATRITIGGRQIHLHESVGQLLSLCAKLPELNQKLIVGSVTDPAIYRNMRGKCDIVISHFLISFWKERWRILLAKFCDALSLAVAPGAVLLLAVGENRHCPEVQAVHEVFESKGFNLKSVIRTWDPYDFDSGPFAQLARGNSVTVPMNESLCYYVCEIK